MRGSAREDAANYAIAEILNREDGWTVQAERAGRVVGSGGARPDIIAETGGGVVIIETEYYPAHTLQGDVERAAGRQIRGHGSPTAVVGVTLPRDIRERGSDEIRDILPQRNDLSYYIQYADGPAYPVEGWLTGSLLDIRTAIRVVSAPRDRIEQCVGIMGDCIENISAALERTDEGIRNIICTRLRQEPSRQTYEMAGLVLLNAGIFYEDLATHLPDITPTENLKVIGMLDQGAVMDAWRKVRKIDYAPIFDDAMQILRALPAGMAGDVLGVIARAVSRIMALNVSRSGDVYGMLYQSMLADRKKAAAFYTRPEAAALLAGLVLPDDDIDNDELRIADFACGTGMLLTAAYDHIIQHTAGTVDHQHIMEHVMYGYDIMPTATNLTVSNLAGLFPSRTFDDTHIYTMPIGHTASGGYYLGSLGLLTAQATLVPSGERHGGQGTTPTNITAVSDGSCDYVLMNPPFVRATNHGAGRTDPVPPFAVFGIGPDEQLEMADINKKLYKNTCAHGHAGLGSYFAAIADRKLRPNGIMGLILPGTVPTGVAWNGFREMLTKNYDDLTLVLVGQGDGTYSADTGMNEVVLVARKRHTNSPRIKLVLLDAMPQSRLDAIHMARQIRTTPPVRLENDMGHTSIQIGDITVGKMLDCPLEGSKWWVGRVSNVGLLSFGYRLAHNMTDIPTTPFETCAGVGKHHLDIWGTKADGSPQGPFNKAPLQPDSRYRALWNNNAETQRSMIVEPDLALEVKHDARVDHVNDVLRTATHIHMNEQAGYGSQRLIAAYTEDTILGGRSWPNVLLGNCAWEKAFVVWCNSVFGVLLYWLHAGSQQPGRGMMPRSAFKTMPMLNFNGLAEEQITKFDELFDGLREAQMLPINHLDEDTMRQKLDRGILEILGVKMDLESLYRQIIQEPQFARR